MFVACLKRIDFKAATLALILFVALPSMAAAGATTKLFGFLQSLVSKHTDDVITKHADDVIGKHGDDLAAKLVPGSGSSKLAPSPASPHQPTDRFLDLAKKVDPESRFKSMDVSEFRQILPNVAEQQITPSLLRLAGVGKTMAERGEFPTRLLNKAPEPIDVLLAYTRYGDKYLEVAAETGQEVSRLASSGELASVISRTAGARSKEIPHIIDAVRDPDAVGVLMASVLKRTGTAGWEAITGLAGIARRNPVKTTATAAFVWFLADPVGFHDAVNSGGKSLEGFVSEISAETGRVAVAGAAGATQGVGLGIKAALSETITDPVAAILGLGAILLVGGMAVPLTRRALFHPFRTAMLRARNKMDTEEAALEEERQRILRQSQGIKVGVVETTRIIESDGHDGTR